MPSKNCPNIEFYWKLSIFQSPLQLAVFSEASTKIVTYLLCNGANFYQTDQEGNSVLHLAVQYVNEAALEVLCEHADKNNLDVDLFNYEGKQIVR